MVGSSPYEVTVTTVEATTLAVCRASADREHIGEAIMGALDKVWPFIRANGIESGHNVVVYYGGPGDMAIGVQTLSPVPANDVVETLQTPAGRVATTTHWGSYDGLHGAFEAVHDYCRREGLQMTGTSWEVYGDWSDDPSKVRTDVFVLIE
jgi:effector-binding domain-containing protein